MIFREVEQKIIKTINESGISIDAIYFIMKSIMAEIEQRYFDFCRQEDIERAEAAQINEEFSSKAEESVATNTNEEGAK